MSTYNAEDARGEQLAATGTELSAEHAARPSSAAIARTLIVGILIAVAGAWIGTHFADRLRVTAAAAVTLTIPFDCRLNFIV